MPFQFFKFLVLMAFGLAVVAPVASAQDEEWTPPEPSPESLDWIKLNSGEWLKGEIKGKRDQNFEFDSDELDLLKLDWGDVAEIRSPRIKTYVFEGDIVVAGPATMKDGTIRIRVGEEVQEYPRENLLSIIEGKPTELNFWSAKASLGVVGRTGNTDQSDFNTVLSIRRDAPKNRLDLGYTGNFGEVNNQQNVNNHRASATFNVFLYRNLFVTVPGVQFYADKFQNISSQYVLAGGLGYFLVRNATVEWEVTLGGGYTSTNYVSVQEGESDSESSAAVIPVTGFEWDITGDIEWSINYNGQIGIPDLKQSIHHIQSLFMVEVWGSLDFTISANLDRVENPRPNEDGIKPVPNDLRVAFGLGLDL